MERHSNLVGKLAYASARRRWWVLSAWIGVLAVAFVLAGGVGDVFGKNELGPVTESGKAHDVIEDRFGGGGPPMEWVIVESETLRVGSPEFEEMVGELAATISGFETVTGVQSYLDGDGSLVSQDGHAALVRVELLDNDTPVESAVPVVEAVDAADQDPRFRVTVVGDGSVQAEFNELAEETLAKGEMLGIGVALVILAVVFGAAVAAGLPILLALAAILIAVATTAVVGQVFPVEEFVVQIITMIGLAVGIDYALFIVKRYKEELGNGATKLEAITLAGETSTKTVIVSGVSVIIALSGMLIVPEVTFRSFGLGAIFVVAAAVLAAATLLPATISILGDKLNWGRLPRVRGRKSAEGAGALRPANGFWDRSTRVVMRHPVASVVLTSALLIATASLSLTINLGSNGLESLPDESDGLHAFHVLTQDFGAGVSSAQIVVKRDGVDGAALDLAIEGLVDAIGDDSYFGATSVVTDESGAVSLVNAVMIGDFMSPEAEDAMLRVRQEYVPATLGKVGATTYVGGATASIHDDVQLITGYLPYVFGFVLSASFVLLLMVFRSVVVPVKAVLMNVLSVGAAYGLLVLVFQEGVGAELLGFKQVPVIEFWLPLFLFSILFGLSMDYHVFMLSRIKERYDETGRNRESVAFGLRSTASIITGAALIMVAVFGGFALGDISSFQQMGFGLAAAVIIDVTLIRSVLVPATMELLGDWNWYFPSWLAWLPQLHIDERGQAPSRPLNAPAGGSE